MGKVDGKVALVTGAGRGIGAAIALKLAREGADLVINDMDPAPLADTVREIERLGRKAVAVPGDVTKKEFAPAFVDAALKAFGRLDIIVNNAGYTWDNVIQKMQDEQWEAIVAVHLTAPFRILRAAAPYVRDAAKRERDDGASVFRKVVNISSISGLNGNPGQANYSSAKAGIIGLTKAGEGVGPLPGQRQLRRVRPDRDAPVAGAARQGRAHRSRRQAHRHRHPAGEPRCDEADDSARPRRHAGRSGGLGLHVLLSGIRLRQRPGDHLCRWPVLKWENPCAFNSRHSPSSHSLPRRAATTPRSSTTFPAPIR
jgi:NADP-dependent 3-hydroxy acid dehydrogenase YdfG